ncbi:hypothetical protein EJB05_48765, partial [Eragrostis curvula]
MSASAPSPPAGASPEPAAEPLMEFFCYECESSVSLPAAAALPWARRPPCPLCRANSLEPGPNPFPEEDPPPPLPPGLLTLSGSEDSDLADDFDDLDDIGMMDPAEARLYLTRLIQERLYEPGDVAATAAAAAVSVLEEHQRGGEPPAPAASIAALPTIEVSRPAETCAICREDLPPASAALKLPCTHLYHSCCVVPWLQMHNSCPVCRSRLPATDPMEASSSEQDPNTTRITIRFTTAPRRRVRANNDGMLVAAPVSASPTQLAQAVNGEGSGGPANSGETVSSEWPPQPESDTLMSEARDGDGFFD